MTPHLHPRSRLTSSLFGATLAVSFLVVAMPHIVPCPAPRVRFADSEFETLEDGRRRRIKPKESPRSSADGDDTSPAQRPAPTASGEEENVMRKAAHECPVPKPSGIVGKLLGFKGSEAEQLDARRDAHDLQLKEGSESRR